MKRQEISIEIRRRVGEELHIQSDVIAVHWLDDGRPKVRIPTRLHIFSEPPDWARIDEIVGEVMEQVEPDPVREMSDTDYAARIKARRKK